MSDQLPANIRDQMEYVICGPHLNLHTTSSFASNTFSAYAVDHAWNFLKFKEGFRVVVQKTKGDEEMEFDLVGIHASIANALRRIMLSEVPTMAIEHVFFLDNTGIVQDEVLAHRLGLVPIKADPRLFEWKTSVQYLHAILHGLGFLCHGSAKLQELPEMNHQVPGSSSSILCSTVDDLVLSRSLKWLPTGSEIPDETNCRFNSNQRDAVGVTEVCPVHEDILLTKLAPGQCIQLEAHCFKGIGKDHAKWSPVATAWYRLCPEVVLLKEVHGKKAKYLTERFPGLFTIDESIVGNKERVHVAEARHFSHYLEQIRELSGDESWSNKLQLRKRKDHFIFSVESTGQYSACDIFSEALDILISKCEKLMESL